ncbi:MAG: right-handed parallel beta-helix repeat-containing protein, partial [Thermoplasmata archaeon]
MFKEKRTFVIILVAFLIFVSMSDFTGFLSNETRGTVISGGHITADTTWDTAGDPYLIEGDVIVDFGVTLTIEPGVRVRFKQNLYLYVVGNLTALGSAADPITLTADVGNNLGHWRSIRINASGHLRMNHCEIKHAKNAIYLFHSQGNTIENTSISQSSTYGIYARESDETKVKNCDLGPNNWIGIYIHRSLYGEVEGCSAFMNDFQGIAVSESSHITITNTDAYNNNQNGLHVFESSDVTVSG